MRTAADGGLRPSRALTRPRAVAAPADGPTRRRVPAELCAVLGGGAIAAAWLVPGTAACAGLGWLAAGLLVLGVRSGRVYGSAFAAGVVGHALGFYWVYGTVAAFGGFGPVASALAFALFVGVGATQFVLFAAVDRRLGPAADALALRGPTAWVISELVAVRVFRWHFGHTQLAFRPMAQAADLGGAMLVSFLMFWLAEAAVRRFVLGETRRAFLLPLAAVGLAVGYGAVKIRAFDRAGGPTQEVVVVQGGAPRAPRGDLAAARRNLAVLNRLSRSASRSGALVVWPEGSVPQYLPKSLGSVRENGALPWRGDGSASLVGGYAYDARGRRYNAAFAVRPNGGVPVPYFKRVLIPFGEYMPFASVVPGLNRLGGRAKVFTAGEECRVFRLPMVDHDGGRTTPLEVAPLVCFEDTIPALAREATLGGATLLVNLTSDAWFGRSVAPAQHHLIASFRAIECRRPLVRATTTGLSAVVDPVGRTVAQVPPFAAGTATARVPLRSDRSLYVAYAGDTPWWTLSAVVIVGLVARRLRGRLTDRPVSD